MGIVNRTPDSFFDGGVYLHDGAAHARVEQLVLEGADIIDVGAESSRPGAPVVSAADQIERLGDVIAMACRTGVLVSVDTTSPEVAEYAVREGAGMINSIALTPAGDLAAIAAHNDAFLVLTHCRASTNDMPDFSTYAEDAYVDVVDDVVSEWLAAAAIARSRGLPAERIIFDPGLGFTKSSGHSLSLAARLPELKRRVSPHRVLMGTSRKSYVASAVAHELGGEPPPPNERLGGSVAAAIDCARRGADILRVHDVAVVKQAVAYATAVDKAARHRVSHPQNAVADQGGPPCSRA